MFTSAEMKEMAQDHVGKRAEEQKAKLKKGNFDYAKIIRTDKMKKYNTNFFYEYYNEENSKILSLFKSTLLEIPKPIEESIIDKKSDEKVFVKESKVKNIESIKVTIKGTNWSIEEKEVFFKCIKELGKNWKLLHEHFPNKTDMSFRSKPSLQRKNTFLGFMADGLPDADGNSCTGKSERLKERYKMKN